MIWSSTAWQPLHCMANSIVSNTYLAKRRKCPSTTCDTSLALVTKSTPTAYTTCSKKGLQNQRTKNTRDLSRKNENFSGERRSARERERERKKEKRDRGNRTKIDYLFLTSVCKINFRGKNARVSFLLKLRYALSRSLRQHQQVRFNNLFNALKHFSTSSSRGTF